MFRLCSRRVEGVGRRDLGPSGLELDMPSLRDLDEINVAKAGENLGWADVSRQLNSDIKEALKSRN